MDYNPHTRITASVMGVLLSLSGLFNHGLFEIFQGNTPTPGFFIEAIGESHRYWIHGTEGAITLIPNFLITGIAVLFVSLALAVWSIRFLQRRKGASVFLALLILLTLVGGGIGHLVLFIPSWIHATRIHKPLQVWRLILTPEIRPVLAVMWKPLLVLTAFSWFMVMEIGIFGWFPGQNDPNIILNICFAFVLLTVLLSNLAYLGAFAFDIEKKS